ncbi:MAG: TPM domain-containing protein [Synechococcus sp.]
MACCFVLSLWDSSAALAQRQLPVVEMDFPEPMVTVLDLAKQLSDNQEAQLDTQLKALEKDTGWKLRVLTQFDRSPGRQVKEYWELDDRSVLMVADPRGGNLLAFNVGDRVREILPRTFWIELQSRYGNQFFVRDNGKAQSILSTINSLDGCFRQGGCRVVPGLPNEQWVLTLATSIAGGIVCGFAGKPRNSDEIFNWQWALLFSPLWLVLFGGFGIGPVLRRTTDWLPITRNVLGFLAGLLTIYVLPFTPSIGDGSESTDS